MRNGPSVSQKTHLLSQEFRGFMTFFPTQHACVTDASAPARKTGLCREAATAPARFVGCSQGQHFCFEPHLINTGGPVAESPASPAGACIRSWTRRLDTLQLKVDRSETQAGEPHRIAPGVPRSIAAVQACPGACVRDRRCLAVIRDECRPSPAGDTAPSTCIPSSG